MGRASSTNIGKARRKEDTTKPKRRWVDGVKIDLREIGWDYMDWIDLAQDRNQCTALTVTNLRVP
jgi:hypothetical protein